MKRGGPKRRYKPKEYDLEAARAWFNAVVHRRALCVICQGRAQEAHHGVPKTVIEDFCREERFSNEQRNALLWEVGNGVPLCQRCHERHTTAFSRVPRSKLPTSVGAFARRLGEMATRRPVTWAWARIEREYPDG